MPDWLADFTHAQPIGWTFLAIAAVATLGLWIGQFRWHGVGLGSAGVLFAGIFLGHFGVVIDSGWLGLIRELGLILFVYTIGLQVGPGFFNSLKKQGLELNSLAAGIVLGGGALAVLIGKLAGFNIALTAGIFAGATTNTPALGAVQEAVKNLSNISPEQLAQPALGYAIAYPFGIVGILLSMILLRSVFRIDAAAENVALAKKSGSGKLERQAVVVTHPAMNGLPIRDIPRISDGDVIVSRILPATGEGVMNVRADTKIHLGDILLAIGTGAALADFVSVVGELSSQNLLESGGRLTSQRVLVTARKVYGRTLRELALAERFDVTITRLTRGDLELPASGSLRLQFGDMLFIVGSQKNVEDAAQALGNSVQELSHTNFIPVFIGIGLGILVGVIPLTIPGIPSAIRLGLAGGPLIVAILLSHLGRVGPVVWYMPPSANLALRELGIILFLSCVGLKAGGHFVESLMSGVGWQWIGAGAVITLLPLLVAGWIGRAVLKQPFTTLCGVLAGSMTDPPALAFANALAGSDAPAVSYATVYPLTMMLRIVIAQMLVLLFAT